MSGERIQNINEEISHIDSEIYEGESVIQTTKFMSRIEELGDLKCYNN